MSSIKTPGIISPNQSMGDAFDQLMGLLGPPPIAQDPATTIRILREKLLDALRREKAALDQVETLRAEVAAKNAEIKRLNDVIGEMSE